MNTRPIYETERDRENELATATEIALRRGRRAYKLPHKFPLDFALLDHHDWVREWLEVKCRTNRFDAYPDYMIAISKLAAMMDLQRITGLQALLAVRWTDRLGVIELPITFDVKIGGRKDRGDTQDLEPVAHIALAQFTLFATVP